jgi:signal transduction histidine kinase
MKLFLALKNNRSEYLVLLPFAGIISIALVLFFYLAKYVTYKEFNAEIKSKRDSINLLIQNEIHSTLNDTTFINQKIAEDINGQNFFLQNNRGALLSYNLDLLKKLNFSFGITHFYFHRPDGTVFLRVHDPKRFDDKIMRQSLLDAEKSLVPTTGIEGGLNGLYTLRSVYPWIINKKLIGFIETGRDISDILSDISDVTNVHFSLNINKQFINKEKYLNDPSIKKRKLSWDSMPDEVSVYSTMDAEEHHHALDNQQTRRSISSDKKSIVHEYLELDFKDLKQNKKGHLVLSFNMDELIHRTSVVRYWFLVIGLIQLLFSLWYLKFLLRHTEDKINVANSLAKFATIGETSASVSHDISGLLTIIQGHTSLALKKASPDNPLYSTLSKIDKATTRMVKISEANRKLSSTDHKNDRTRINIKSSVEDVHELISPALLKKEISLLMDVASFDQELNCNPIQISQVLMNLINNARDAIAEDPNEKWIKVGAKVVQNNFEISITNSGPLISREVRKKLFKTSFTTKTSEKGTGLGLGICKKIIESHKGKIFCSDKSEHTQFIVILPIT